MRKTMWEETTRRELIERLGRLTPETAPRWGKMNGPRMLAHIGSSMRMGKGEIVVTFKNHPAQYSPLKQIIIYLLPFPKGAPTAPELLSRDISDWNENIADVQSQIESFATWESRGSLPVHPLFGKLSGREWGVLGYRHTDHHFRQFGV